MPIPDFQTMMLPYLQVINDGQEHNLQDVINQLAEHYHLTIEERYRRSPNSPNIIFNNKVGWTNLHLKKAGLVESPRRGIVKITEEGLRVLEQNPPRVDMRYLLDRYPPYVQFRTASRQTPVEIETIVIPEGPTPQVGGIILTPTEAMDQSYQEIRNNLANDLLEQIMICSPQFFEKMVIHLLISMGYGGSNREAGQAIGQSHDGGIDGIINEDKLGLDVIYIQAKRWISDRNVGATDVRSFVGSLAERHANKGIFITTSDFTNEAYNTVRGIAHKVVLINGYNLTQLMIDHGVGVTEITSYSIKRVDTDYFTEE